MKIKMTELGLELEPETSFEKECLKHLANQNSISVSFKDKWDQTGAMTIEGKPDPWDKKK